MATTFTVLCPNGRRVTIKATPTTTLMQVLEQACAKQKLDPNVHALKHHSKLLDLNNLIRYTNLPQNAKLEMVTIDKPRTEATEVVLAVQCEDFSRVQGKFNPNSTSLWGVLTQLKLVTEDDGMGRFEPVIVYMNNQICGESSLKQKLLKDLGLTSGKVLVRLLFRERQSEPSIETSSSLSSQGQDIPSQDQGKNSARNKDEPMESETSTSQETASTEQNVLEMIVDSDDEQPKSKLKDPNNRKRPAARTLDPISEGASGTTVDDGHHLPYFPAHPINIFPQDEPLARQLQPQQPQLQLVSQFLQQHPLAVQDITPHIPTLEPFKFPEVLAQVDSRPQSKVQDKPQQRRVYDEPCDRETVVYHVDDSLPVTPSEELPDEFFNVTVQDVQSHYSDLKKQAETDDSPLMTQVMRKIAKARKYEHYSVAVIRVHFPDQWIVQGCFKPNESLKAIVKFVREHLADPQLKFHLYTTPPKNVLRSGRVTLVEAGFVPAAIIHLGLDSPDDMKTPLLSEKSLQSAQSALQAEIVMSSKWERKSPQGGSQMSATGSLLGSTNVSSQPRTSGSSTSGSGGAAGAGGRKVPKWFKVGK